MDNFLVTGCGRSGTKFLARTMNRSPSWSVHHERAPYSLTPCIPEVQQRFERPRYGEVNSLLRMIAPHLKVARRAVILRQPEDILLSFFNKAARDGRNWRNFIEHLVEMFSVVAGLVKSGFQVIRFAEMTTCPDYLRSTCESLMGAPIDFEISKESLAPINALKERERFATSFDDLPPELRQIRKGVSFG